MSEETKTYNIPTDISALKSRLDTLNSEKEKWFAKKEELKQKIAGLIQNVRVAKATNDKLSKNIKELKERRETQNQEVRRLISEIKAVQQKKTLVKKDPEALAQRIKQLETRIETGAVSFDQEKKLMIEIKQLKKEHDAAKEADTAYKSARELSKNIDEAKKAAETFHAQMSALAIENKDAYKEFQRLSKEINTIKKEEEEAFAKFVAFKQEFSVLNKVFQERMKNKMQDVQFRKQEKEKAFKEKEMKQLEKNKEKVEEKIKTRKVLTTEDIIAFQGSDE